MFRLLPVCFFLFLLIACGETKKTPLAPSNITATPGPGYITITWQDNSDNETGFVIYRAGGSALQAQATSKIGEVGKGVTKFLDTNISLDSEYRYSVLAKNADGESTQTQAGTAAKVTPGVDLTVGNFEDLAGQKRTLFLVYLFFPKVGVTPQDVTLTVTGPAGWNDGQTVVNQSNQESLDRGFQSLGGDAPVTGEYRLEVNVKGQTYQATANLTDTSFVLVKPQNITVTDKTTTTVSATWDAVPNAVAYGVALWDSSRENRFAGYVNVKTTSHTFSDLDLEPGEYLFEVVPWSVDVSTLPEKVSPISLSIGNTPFTVVGDLSPNCSSPAQVVIVPDANLRQAIRDALGKSSGDLTCLDMALLTELDETVAAEKGISNLEGLQYAINLRDAQLSDNAVTDASPLAGLEHIEWLNLNGNQISNLMSFENLTSLRGLYLSDPSNAYTDISPLNGLTQLEELDIGGHELGNIDFLADFDNLSNLWTWGNGLDNADMAVLAGKTLDILNLEGNEVSDLTFLAGLPNLVEFNGNDNGISDITPLTALVNLTALYLEENEITDIAPLVANAGLDDGDEVDVSENLLDVTDGSDDKNNIDALVARGVSVIFDNQKIE